MGWKLAGPQYARDITIHPHAACASCSKGLTEHWFSAPRQSVRWRLTSLAKGLDGAPPCAGAVNLLAQSEYCLLFQIFEEAAIVIPTKGIILAMVNETNVTSLHRPSGQSRMQRLLDPRVFRAGARLASLLLEYMANETSRLYKHLPARLRAFLGGSTCDITDP